MTGHWRHIVIVLDDLSTGELQDLRRRIDAILARRLEEELGARTRMNPKNAP
jgi:hypothetical protein